MSNFDDFFDELVKLSLVHEKKNTHLKIERDSDFDIIKILGQNISALGRAKNGLNEMSELAYTTAEHHPFWNLIYNCSEISQSVLEKWEGNLSKQDLDDIEWSLKEIKHTLKKLRENSNLE